MALLLFPFLSEVGFGFEFAEYSVGEGEGFVTVCVVSRSASLTYPHSVTIETSEKSNAENPATGNHFACLDREIKLM